MKFKRLKLYSVDDETKEYLKNNMLNKYGVSSIKELYNRYGDNAGDEILRNEYGNKLSTTDTIMDHYAMYAPYYRAAANRRFSLLSKVFRTERSKYENDVINNMIERWYDEDLPFYIPDMYIDDDVSPIADCLHDTDFWFDMIAFPDEPCKYSERLKPILRSDDYEFLCSIEKFMNNYFKFNKSKIYSSSKCFWKFDDWEGKNEYPDYKYRSMHITPDGKLYIRSKNGQDYVVIPVSVIKHEIKSSILIPDESIFYIDEPAMIAINPSRIIQLYKQTFGKDYKRDSK